MFGYFFKYERLPMFCYRCGIPGHQDHDCQEINKGCFHMNDDVFEYSDVETEIFLLMRKIM